MLGNETRSQSEANAATATVDATASNVCQTAPLFPPPLPPPSKPPFPFPNPQQPDQKPPEHLLPADKVPNAPQTLRNEVQQCEQTKRFVTCHLLGLCEPMLGTL